MSENPEHLADKSSAEQHPTQSRGAPNPDGLWSQLGNAVALAAKQDQIVWAVFGVFWAANAVLLVALFTTGDLPKRSVGLVVSIVGSCALSSLDGDSTPGNGMAEVLRGSRERTRREASPRAAFNRADRPPGPGQRHTSSRAYINICYFAPLLFQRTVKLSKLK
jgi:hypothetical protein